MTKAILLPSRNHEALKPLTYHSPVGLLPIVNKPLLEHQIEFLVRNGIQHVRIHAGEFLQDIEKRFDSGAQWGASVSYSRDPGAMPPVSALKKMKTYFQGATLLVMESDILADIDLNEALEFHSSNRAEITFLCYTSSVPTPGLSLELDSLKRVRAVRMNSSPAGKAHLVDTGICIIEPEVLELLLESAGNTVLHSCWLSSLKVRLNMYAFHIDGPYQQITNRQRYYKIQSDILARRFPNVVIPGIEVQPDVWIGRNVHIAPGVHFDGPAVIGDDCRIERNARIGSNTILGSGVTIDTRANVQRSLVLNRTRIASNHSVHDSILVGSLHVDLEKDSCGITKQAVTLSRTHRPTGSQMYLFANKLVALGLLVLSLPFVVLAILWAFCSGRTTWLSSVKRLGADPAKLNGGILKLRVFDMYYLGALEETGEQQSTPFEPATQLPRSLARIGNLINVVKGDILFVGNAPMDPECAFALDEEWQRTRFKCQAGMFSVLDAQERHPLTEDEKTVVEARYALRRSIRSDLKVVWEIGTRATSRLLRKGRRVLPV